MQLSKREQYIQEKGMLTDQQMYQRYLAKQEEFDKQADISLIGHSLFDMWSDLPTYSGLLKNKTMANLGVSGISTYQYLEILVRKERIKYLGKTVFIFLGVNDIVKEIDYSTKQLMDWLIEIFQYLQTISPMSDYYLLGVTPLAEKQSISNTQIRALNDYLKEYCPIGLHFIETYDAFADEKQNLHAELHTDGLHFSAKGYEVLSNLLERFIPSE